MQQETHPARVGGDSAPPSRRAPWARTAIGVAVLLGLLGQPVAGAEPGIQIELNKIENDNNGSCLASLVLRNELRHTLDRFSLDLYVFDSEGIIARQVLLDLAPLRKEKTTVARFTLVSGSCDGVGWVLINDISSCRADSGEQLDCLTSLTASSRTRIGLEK